MAQQRTGRQAAWARGAGRARAQAAGQQFMVRGLFGLVVCRPVTGACAVGKGAQERRRPLLILMACMCRATAVQMHSPLLFTHIICCCHQLTPLQNRLAITILTLLPIPDRMERGPFAFANVSPCRVPLNTHTNCAHHTMPQVLLLPQCPNHLLPPLRPVSQLPLRGACVRSDTAGSWGFVQASEQHWSIAIN